MCQALQAEREFDACRGVPIEAFIWKRVLGRLLAAYRKEWRECGIPNRLALQNRTVTHDAEEAASASDGIASLLIGFSEHDRWMLRRAIVDQQTEGRIAAELGVTQQAVSKRLRGLLGRLKCRANKTNKT